MTSTEMKVISGIIIVSVVIIVGSAFFISNQDAKEKARLEKGLIGEKISDGSQHIGRNERHPAYKSNPPTSGWHWEDGTAGGGIHDKEIPDELLVHSMEHGAVVVWYKSDLPKDQIEQITNIFTKTSVPKKILIPRKSLDVPIALTSWEHLIKLQSVDEKQITAFINTNSDRAPEKAII